MGKANYNPEIKIVLDSFLLKIPIVVPGKMFGYPAYYVNKKLFACVYEDGVGVKVPFEMANELIGKETPLESSRSLKKLKTKFQGGILMFKEMRRHDKALTNEEMLEIMNIAEYGVLSTIGEDGFPYGVPVNFVYKDNKIYFHSAVKGHKLDNMSYSNKVSFCVVEGVSIIPDDFNTKFQSVISFGSVEEIEGDKKQEAYVLLLEKYSKDYMEAGMEYINKFGAKAKAYQIEVSHMTAKGKKYMKCLLRIIFYCRNFYYYCGALIYNALIS